MPRELRRGGVWPRICLAWAIMIHAWSDAAHAGGSPNASASDAARGERAVPGLPRTPRALAPLGALTGGALSGAVLGISAGPIAARVGAGMGACVGLMTFLAAGQSRRRREPTRAPAEGETETATERLFFETQHELVALRRTSSRMRRSFVRCLGQVVGWPLMLTGGAAVFVTWCLLGDDHASDAAIFGMGAFSIVVLGSGAVVVWRSAGRAANPAELRGSASNASRPHREQRFRSIARRRS